jgi:hypothetical protein
MEVKTDLDGDVNFFTQLFPIFYPFFLIFTQSLPQIG